MIEWLVAEPIRLPSGAYLAWVGGDGTEFTYPETAAIAIRLACWWADSTGDPDILLRIIPTLSFLEESVTAEGAVHHRECDWLFDSLLALSAFEGARRAGVSYSSTKVITRLVQGSTRMLTEGTAVRPVKEARWSSCFGPHLLKPAALVLAQEMGDETLRSAIRQVLPELISYQNGEGAFKYPGESRTYLHAHCYALEGLAILGTESQRLKDGLSYLRTHRRPDGGLGRWAGTPSPLAADVTAQAGRLFLMSGEQDLALAASAALAPLRTASGALRYHSDSDHENSWSTAFAAQLDHGLSRGLSPFDLV